VTFTSPNFETSTLLKKVFISLESDFDPDPGRSVIQCLGTLDHEMGTRMIAESAAVYFLCSTSADPLFQTSDDEDPI
jgi:hypothetical protein